MGQAHPQIPMHIQRTSITSENLIDNNTWDAWNASLLTVVFVKSPPSDRADEPFDPEVPKTNMIFRELEINYHHRPKGVYDSESKLYLVQC